MAAPPYSYGGASYGNRDAILAAMQGREYDPNKYQYQTNVPMVKTRGPSVPGVIADAGAALATTPMVAKSILKGVGVTPSAGMGAGASLGLGLATELGGALLKPKGQAATASPYADITDQYKRREEGSGEGTLGGAVKWGGRGAQLGSVVPGIGTAVGAGVGALAGGIGNAFTKNAASAYSDFSRDDAIKAISDMYETRGGRLPTADEVNDILVSQGGNGKWVGEKGLYGTLANLDKNFAQERAQRAGAGEVGVGNDGGADQAYGLGGRGGATSQTDQQLLAALNANAGGGGAEAAGAAPAEGAPDPSTFNTDGYAAPQVVKPATGAPPAGWDQTKWADPTHQTPKYAVGRILAGYSPDDAGWEAATAEVQQAYPGTKIIGNDKLDIPGVGVIDVRLGADAGGQGWWWGAEDGGGGGAAQGEAGAGSEQGLVANELGDLSAGYDQGGDLQNNDALKRIIAQIGKYTGGGQGVMSQRDALLAQLGA